MQLPCPDHHPRKLYLSYLPPVNFLFIKLHPSPPGPLGEQAEMDRLIKSKALHKKEGLYVPPVPCRQLVLLKQLRIIRVRPVQQTDHDS